MRDEVGGGARRAYAVRLAAGEYLRAVVTPSGVDVAIVIHGPDGAKVMTVDLRPDPNGAETLDVVVAAAGAHRLEVASADKASKPAPFELRVEAVRPPSDEDRARARALATFERAIEENKPDAESRRRAIASFREAASLARALGDARLESVARNNGGFLLDAVGDRDAAVVEYERALELRRGLGDRVAEATTLNNLGRLLTHVGDVTRGLDMLRAGLEIRRSLGLRGQEATSLMNLAAAYKLCGEWKRAVETYEAALAIRRELGDRRGEGSALTALGAMYAQLGEYERAVETTERGLAMLTDAADPAGQETALTTLAQVRYEMGDPEGALALLERTAAQRREKGERAGESRTLANIAVVRRFMRDDEGARAALQRSLELARETQQARQEARALSTLALFDLEADRTAAAVEALVAALAIARRAGDRQEVAVTLGHLGRGYAAAGDRAAAVAALEEAIAVARDVGDWRVEAKALAELARVELSGGDLDRARDRAEAAVALVETRRSALATGELRAALLGSYLPVYETPVDVLLALDAKHPGRGHDAAALVAAERARAQRLLESLAEARVDLRRGVDAALLAREREARERLNAAARAAARGAAVDPREIDRLRVEVRDLVEAIRRQSPDYAALERPEPLNLAALRREVLDDRTALVEYAIRKDSSIVWVATRAGLVVRRIAGRAEIDALAREWHEAVAARARRVRFETADERRARVAKADAAVAAAGRALSRAVLAPVADQLSGRRLLVVPDGALHYVSFAALPDPAARAPRALVESHEIAVLASASTALAVRPHAAPAAAATRVAVLADPVYAETDERVKRVGAAPAAPAAGHLGLVTRSVDDDGWLARLTNSRREAMAIVEAAGRDRVTLGLDFDASREMAVGRDVAAARVVHFATHGYVDTARPELSGIVLSTVDAEGRPRDGFLRAHDIFAMRLPADLVVLSGCRTGMGKQIEGEGLLGLTRGFLHAGATRVVVSLWAVDDASTAELMRRMYRGMFGPQRLAPAAALAEAQRTMARDPKWREPYYWAAFQIQGAP